MSLLVLLLLLLLLLCRREVPRTPKFATTPGVLGVVGWWRGAGSAVCFPVSPRSFHFQENSLGVCHCRRLLFVLLTGVGSGGVPFFFVFECGSPCGHRGVVRTRQGFTFVFVISVRAVARVFR